MASGKLSPEELEKRVNELIGEVENGEYKRAIAPNHAEPRVPNLEEFEKYVKSGFVKSLSDL